MRLGMHDVNLCENARVRVGFQSCESVHVWHARMHILMAMSSWVATRSSMRATVSDLNTGFVGCSKNIDENVVCMYTQLNFHLAMLKLCSPG